MARSGLVLTNLGNLLWRLIVKLPSYWSQDLKAEIKRTANLMSAHSANLLPGRPVGVSENRRIPLGPKGYLEIFRRL